MAKKRSNSDNRKEKIEGSQVPPPESTLKILPLSHVEFKAIWSLSQNALDAGLQAAAQDGAQPHLVLRAYSLPAESSSSDYSDIWRDFSIDSLKSGRHFTLPKPTPKIRAVIGLINSYGRFKPLIRGEAIPLPPSPDILAAKKGDTTKPASLDNENATRTPETATKFTERNRMDPPIGQIGYHSPPSHALSGKPNQITDGDNSTEDIFSQWEAIWKESAPIDLLAEFVVSGKIAPGMKILLGSQILNPDSDGFFEWKQRLTSFKQVWPLLEEVLVSPSVDAGPSLEFFKESKSSQKLLELDAALKIIGKVNDPDYRSLLPKGLDVDENGTFRLSRMLPEGAVILPGLSLITTR